jgi:hypothetical protein
MDEAGYTGEDLLNAEQPIFALASTILDDSVCQAIYRDVFQGVKAQELKHVALARKAGGQQRVIEFLRAVYEVREKIRAYPVHKEFCLLTMLVDWWVEPSMHRHGYDLYERGGHIALSNLSYVTLVSVGSPSFLRLMLQKFQVMMRERSPQAFREFWGFLSASHDTAHPLVREILEYFIHAGIDLGMAHLRSLPEKVMDIAMTVAAGNVNHWRSTLTGPFDIIHDKSSPMAREKWLWDQLVSPTQKPAELGAGDRRWHLPLNVVSTTFQESHNILQLQFADLLAGSMARYTASRIDKARRGEYTDKLEEVGIRQFLMGGIWPSDEVDPKDLGTEAMKGAVVDELAARITLPQGTSYG